MTGSVFSYWRQVFIQKEFVFVNSFIQPGLRNPYDIKVMAVNEGFELGAFSRTLSGVAIYQ
jgi:hypothetical protein